MNLTDTISANNAELSWISQEGATNYVIQINTTNTYVVTTKYPNATLELPPGTYSASVTSNNTCGQSATAAKIVLTIPRKGLGMILHVWFVSV